MDGRWLIRDATEQGRSPWVRVLLATERNTAVGVRPGVVRARLATRRDPIAAVLLDQRVQAGLGTIWTSESLFARHVSPWRPACDVVDPDSLLMTARELMRRPAGGDGRQAPRVHGRTGRPCVRGGAPRRDARVGAAPMDRTIVWCESCQQVSDE